jgi:hypothetical protein
MTVTVMVMIQEATVIIARRRIRERNGVA